MVTAAYHPQTNGLDEKTNDNVKRYVLSFYFTSILLSKHLYHVCFTVPAFRALRKLVWMYFFGCHTIFLTIQN